MDEKEKEGLNPEIQKILEKDAEIRSKMAEIYSQCWDDEAFKARFVNDPKSVMDEYEVEYDDTKEYKVLDSKDRTLTYVLPFERVKEAIEGVADAFREAVKDVCEAKQIIPENWAISLIQNTEDTNFLVIPMSPEELTPEELEFVNGGGWFFIYNSVFIVNATALALLNVVAVAQVAGAIAYVAAIGVAVVIAAVVV